MNTGQMMLTLGALMLISTIILNFNRAINDIDSSLDFNRFRREGLSILTSHIEQVSQFYFDETTTDTSSDKNLTDFTLPNLLGFEFNDSAMVDDIDDLNGTTTPDTGISGVIYNVNYNIEYVFLHNSGVITHSATRQYHKRVTINLYDAYNPPLVYNMVNGVRVRDTLSVNFVVSYWFYN